MNKTEVTALVMIIVVAIFLWFKPTAVEISEPLALDATVLAYGDSLTYGKGARSSAYPLVLERLINRRVINAGVSGEVSSSGLQRLGKVLKQYHPALVILCHGGNDILRRKSKEMLKENLRKMIALSKKSGAEVLLVGVPGFALLGANTLALYSELSEEESVMYEGEVLEKIENDSSLKSDQIHPNAEGYKMMAASFKAVLKEHGLI